MARRGTSRLNLLLGIDKPVGITSHDVVARVRRALNERRVGHAGTLDPLASGVMVVGVGQATRLLGMLTLDTKSYLARISFGIETATDDAEGEVVRRVPIAPALADPAAATQAVAALVGPQDQVPPAYSAISVDGVRSYRRARAGEDVELPARRIEVFDALLLGIDTDGAEPIWTVAFTVSKGTYIRALARDLGRSLGSAAHLAGLERRASGFVRASACLSLEGLNEERARAGAIDPVAALGVPAAVLPAARLDDVLCGRAVPLAAASQVTGTAPAGEGGRMAVVVNGELRAIAAVSGDALMMKQVFPQGIGGVRL